MPYTKDRIEEVVNIGRLYTMRAKKPWVGNHLKTMKNGFNVWLELNCYMTHTIGEVGVAKWNEEKMEAQAITKEEHEKLWQEWMALTSV